MINVDELEQQWTAARDAADRLRSALWHGAVPNELDIDAIRSYSQALIDARQAVGLEGVPSLSAVASLARETQLERSLGSLRGPVSLGGEIQKLREVTSGPIAVRIDHLIKLVKELDPHVIISLSRDLGGAQGPPAANLIDTALTGQLTIVSDKPTPHNDSGVTDVMPMAMENAATGTLVANVAAGKFELAHEIARATGQDFRARILAEAALCHNSPTASFEALSSIQVPMVAEDLGSLVLHVASLLRVALFDPDPGTLALLEDVIPALDPFPALSVLAGIAIEVSSDTADGAATVKSSERAEAEKKAEEIAKWAKKVLERLPRQSRIFQGRWARNDGTNTEWPISRILSLVSGNEVAQVDKVRALCAPLLQRAGIAEEIEQAERQTRRSWTIVQRPLMDSDKNYLIQQIEEIVRRAASWCDARMKATVDDALSERRRRIVTSSRILMPQIVAELDYIDGDSWLKAAAHAAKTSVSTSLCWIMGDGLEPDLESLTEVYVNFPLTSEFPAEAALSASVDPAIIEQGNDEGDQPRVDIFDGESRPYADAQVAETTDFVHARADIADDLIDEADIDGYMPVVQKQTSQDRDRPLVTIEDEVSDLTPDACEAEVSEDEPAVLDVVSDWSAANVLESHEQSIDSEVLERKPVDKSVNGEGDGYVSTPQNEGDSPLSDECEFDDETHGTDDDEFGDEWLDQLRTTLERAEPPSRRHRFIGLPSRPLK